jgi:hypothetical protein
MPDPDSITWSHDHDDDRYEVLLHPDDEMAGPELVPATGRNLSAGFMFRAVIRPIRSEYVTIPMRGADRDASITKQLAVSKWNMLCEAAPFTGASSPTPSVHRK